MSFKLNHLPKRTKKPRHKGITLVLDKGFGVRQAEDFCETASPYTDIVKLGWGTSYVTQNLEEKINAYADAGITVYFCGTLFEAYVLRDQLSDYLELLNRFHIRRGEVSDGTICLSDQRNVESIEMMSQEVTVLSEIGSKSPNGMSPRYKWVSMSQKGLGACSW